MKYTRVQEIKQLLLHEGRVNTADLSRRFAVSCGLGFDAAVSARALITGRPVSPRGKPHCIIFSCARPGPATSTGARQPGAMSPSGSWARACPARTERRRMAGQSSFCEN